MGSGLSDLLRAVGHLLTPAAGATANSPNGVGPVSAPVAPQIDLFEDDLPF